MQKNQIKWTKMSGAGNSFWITHLMDAMSSKNQSINTQTNWGAIAQSLCYQTNKTDGLVVLLPSKTCDFKWLFYNADSSIAEMCGNAACCVIDYIFKKKLVKTNHSKITIQTLSQKIIGELYQGKAKIFVKQNDFDPLSLTFNFNQKTIHYTFIDSGVPHGVIELKKWPDSALTNNWEFYKPLAQYLRKPTKQYTKGMNVSFYCPQNQKNILDGISFERGIENFTSACGTGALAIAQSYHQSHPTLDTIFINMPGGQLQVGFHSDKKMSLMSPVKWHSEIIK